MIALNRRAAALLSGGLLLIPIQATYAAPVSARSSAHASRIDPQAVQALRNMSAYLRTLDTFQIHVATDRQEIDERGRKRNWAGTIDYMVRRPNGLLIRSNETGRMRELVYNGKTLTLYTPSVGYYAQVPAPPTIRQTLALAADRYDVHPPLVDLFKWGEGEHDARSLTSARFVRADAVDGQPADEYAFTRKGVAYRIWIAQGARPVPLRVTVTGVNQPERLTFKADLAWTTTTQFADNTFDFQPSAGSRQIGIASSQ